MHDACNLEGIGLPAIVISTTAFVQAADAQSKALGIEPTIVWLPHPIQDRTDEELNALADSALEEIVEKMTQ